MAIPTLTNFVFGEQLSSSDMNQILTDLGTLYNGGVADASVVPAKLSSAARWWEQLGTTTLSGAGDSLSIGSLTAKRFLKVFAVMIDTGGTINANLTFNADTGANYAIRVSQDGGADATAGSATSISAFTTAAATRIFVELEIINIASEEKLIIGANTSRGTAGAANTPQRRAIHCKWANTSNAISTVTFTNTGTGDYAIGSQVVVLGHD